jgi:hypothetical protein
MRTFGLGSEKCESPAWGKRGFLSKREGQISLRMAVGPRHGRSMPYRGATRCDLGHAVDLPIARFEGHGENLLCSCPKCGDVYGAAHQLREPDERRPQGDVP